MDVRAPSRFVSLAIIYNPVSNPWIRACISSINLIQASLDYPGWTPTLWWHWQLLLRNSSSIEAPYTHSDKSDKLQTYGPYSNSMGLQWQLLVPWQGYVYKKSSVVAISGRMGKPLESTLATNEEYSGDAMVNYLATICSILKKVSDRRFCFRSSNRPQSRFWRCDLSLRNFTRSFRTG